MTRYLIAAGHDLLEECMRIGIAKRQMPAQHSKQYNTAAPDIRIEWVIIPLSFNHLRSGVARRRAKGLQLILLVVKRPKSKIDDFQLPIVIDEYIFWLQVTMRHTVAMQILNSFDDLLEEDAGLVLGDSALN